MNRTKISWADYTWNPVVGCTGACPYCYARRMAHRFHRDFTPHWEERNFQRPLPRKPSRIFVNSMSDVADWEPEWMERVESKMRERPDHTFLLLSKRPWSVKWILPSQAMLGYTVTRQADVDALLGHGCAVDFFSVEPLLGPITCWPAWNPRWIIVGAETGNRRGKVVPALAWIFEIERYAKEHGIPLFFKDSLRAQLGEDDHFPFPQELPPLPGAKGESHE